MPIIFESKKEAKTFLKLKLAPQLGNTLSELVNDPEIMMTEAISPLKTNQVDAHVAKIIEQLKKSDYYEMMQVAKKFEIPSSPGIKKEYEELLANTRLINSKV